MGLNQAATIQAKLLEQHGMEADMPVALVENGTSIKQRVVDGVLTQLGELAQQVESPALIVVGRVVELRDKLNWVLKSLTHILCGVVLMRTYFLLPLSITYRPEVEFLPLFP